MKDVSTNPRRQNGKDPSARVPLCGSKRTYRSKARPRQTPKFKVQTTQMGLGHTQCTVNPRRPAWVREVSPGTALISLSLPSKMRWRPSGSNQDPRAAFRSGSARPLGQTSNGVQPFIIFFSLTVAQASKYRGTSTCSVVNFASLLGRDGVAAGPWRISCVAASFPPLPRKLEDVGTPQ